MSLLPFTRYGYPLSDGDRTSTVGITTNAMMLGGTIDNHIDGSYARSTAGSFYWTNGQSNRWVKYDFGSPQYVSEFIISVQNDGGQNTTSGVWALEGSNDDASYVTVSEEFNWIANSSTFNHRVLSLSSNTAAYRYYRLTQKSGTTAQNPYQIEIVFRILDGSGQQADVAPTYDSYLGRGSRRDVVLVTSGTTQGALFNAPGSQGTIVDGILNNSNYFINSRTNGWINFEFPHPVIIDEATWYQDTAATHGTWQWRGSNDAVIWDDIGGTFTLGGIAQVISALNGNTAEYRYYRLQQISGATSSSPYVQEIRFRVGLKGTSTPPTEFTSDIIFDYALSSGESFEVSLTVDYSLIADPLNADINLDYRILEVFETDLRLDYLMEETKPNRITQIPVLALTAPPQYARITQLPVLVAALPEQDTRITQQLVLPLVFYRDVPRPSDILPISPIREVWQWLTAVTLSTGSKEQRAALRPNPRYRIYYDFVLRDPDQRRALYNLIYKSQDKFFEYPMYHAWSRLTQESDQGDNRLYFNIAHTDIRVGEKLAIFDTFSQITTTHSVISLEPDGAYIADDLDRPVGPGHVVCPVTVFRMPPTSSGISMVGTTGNGSLVIESLGTRSLTRTTVTLPTLAGVPILNKVPVNEADEDLVRGVEWLDTGTSAPAYVSRWPFARMSGRREFKLDRETEMDWWRQLMNYANGQRRFFWLQSFYNDLPLIDAPAPGASIFTTDNLDAFEFLRVNSSYKAVAFHTRNGIVYRQIGGSWLNYNSQGEPISMSFTTLAPIGVNPGDNQIHKVSYLHSVRLGSDEVEITHEVGYSVIAFNIQAVNQ